MIKKSYYAIIPANVRYDEELTPAAKLLFGEIAALSDKDGCLFFDNDAFAGLYAVSKTTVLKWVRELSEKNYIEFIENKNIVEELKGKSLNGLGYGNKVCSWCGIFTSVLHEHHHPIPKIKGGTETVDICPNCHHEFHFSQRKIKLVLTPLKLAELNYEKRKVGQT